MGCRLFAAVIFAFLVQLGETNKWSYDRADKDMGPDEWMNIFPHCKSFKQSPINIEDGTAHRVPASQWKLGGWNRANKFEVHDDGHAGLVSTFSCTQRVAGTAWRGVVSIVFAVHQVKFSLTEGRITTGGGNLDHEQMLLQFHLHWGVDNSVGSEHQIDSHQFPLEMHMVHRRIQFNDVSSAVMSEEQDALGVLGYLFKIQENDNPKLDRLIEGVKAARLSSPAEDYEIESLVDLTDQVVDGDYYRYYGSLTTPGCNEIVQWTMFTTPIGISANQMDTIRNYKVKEKGNFFRDPQALNSRHVIRYEVVGNECNTHIY